MSYDLGTAHGTIEIDYDGAREVDRAERDMDKLRRGSRDTDRDLRKLGNTLGRVFGAAVKGAGVGLLVTGLVHAGAAAGALGIQLLGVIPALASISSLAAALPGLFVGIGASVGVLKAAFAGVGDAITAAFDTENPEEFRKSLEKLSPAAQGFARAVKAVVPGLKELQQGLQEYFFQVSALESNVPRAAAALASMRPELNGLVSVFAELTRRVTNFALSANSIEFMRRGIIAFRDAVSFATVSVFPLLNGIRDVGKVGLQLLPRLGAAARDVGIRFGEWLSEVSRDGRLQSWIETAISTLKELGGIVANVGSIFNTLGRVAQSVGGSLLGILEEVTGQAAAFLKTTEGQEALSGLFRAILSIARALLPVITSLASALARALGPAIEELATDLGPVLLEVVEALAPAFGPLATAIKDVLKAVAPLLPPLAKLVSLIAGHLAASLSALASELGPVIELLGGALSDALTELSPLFAEFAATVLPLAAELGTELARAFAPLAPVIVELARAFADALLPVLPRLAQTARQMVPAFVALAEALAEGMAEGISAIIPHLPVLVEAFASLAAVMPAVVISGVRVLTFFLNMGTAVRRTVLLVAGIMATLPRVMRSAFNAAASVVLSVGQRIIDFFVRLPTRLKSAISALPGVILGIIRRTMNGAATALGFGLGLMVGMVTKFPFNVGRAMGSLVSRVSEIVSRAWTRARELFNYGISSAVSLAHQLPNRVRSAISSLSGQMSSSANSAWSRLRSAFSTGISRAVSIARTLPNRIRGALGGLGSLLYGAGRSIINGLISGISSGIGRVLSMVRGLASRVRGAFSSALAIFSPSRVFFEFGVNIDEGVIEGIKSKLRAVGRMAQTLAKTTISPTLSMPKNIGSGLVQNALPALPGSPPQDAPANRQSGPYYLELDGRVVAGFVVDTITGNPTIVSKASHEGSRQSSWSGSGRVRANAS